MVFLVLITAILVGNIGTLNAFAEEDGVSLEIKTSKPNFHLSDEKMPIIVVINNNANFTMTVTDVSLSSKFFNLEESGISKPNIELKSSTPIEVDLTKKENMTKGNYSLAITIAYVYNEDKDEKTYTVTKTFDIVLVEKPTLIEKLPYTNILLLLALFYIPSQIIERIISLSRVPIHKIVDRLDKNSKPHLEKVRIDEYTKRREQLIKKLKEAVGSNKTTTNTLTVDENEAKFETEVATITTDNTKIQEAIDQINGLLKKANDAIARHAINKENLNVAFAILAAFLPAILLSSFHIGMLQILGLQNDYIFFFDTIISALFIGSGTKPIHEIIKAVTAARS